VCALRNAALPKKAYLRKKIRLAGLLGQRTGARPDHRTVSKSSPYIRAPVHATAAANATTRSASGRMRLSRKTSLDMAPNSILSVSELLSHRLCTSAVLANTFSMFG
jgi:hypothetical protein